MNSLPWKKIAIGGVAVVIAVVAIFFFKNSQGTKPGPSYINPAFGEYITSYTAGVIPSGSTLRIILANDAVDSSLIGQESSVKLFSLSPSVSGKTIWLDRRTVEFRPESRLTSGQVYAVTFGLSKLLAVPAELNNFEYTFQVIPQNFELAVDNIKPYVKTELKRQKIEGTLFTADFAENTSVEKMLLPEQEGKSLNVTWTHNPDGKQHTFIVEDVARKDQASKVQLKVTGEPLGLERSEEEEVEIPSLSDFKLMNAKVVQNPNQYVVLQFSDPLKEKQNLEGLISITDLASLDFDIHDNEIWVYPPVRQSGSKTVNIEAGIRNILDYKMKTNATAEVVFEQLAPAVRFTGKGSILPSTDGMVLPFEAVNLNAVDVTVMKVFENNILQFFQVNNLEGTQELRRVGKKIITKTIQLDNTGVTDLGKWNRFTLDLSKLISTEPGAIYQVKLAFKKAYSTYNCDGEEETEETTSQFEEYEDDYEYEGGYYDEYEEYYYGDDYDWEQRDNPCHSSYYTSNKSIKRNVLASDLGLTAKGGDDGNLVVFVNDLKTTQSLASVQLELYDYQQQLIGTASTDSDGKATIHTKEEPFAIIAKNGTQRGYLKVTNGDALSVSNFDVSGEVIQRGIKGFLYGDRGVWRPGDSLYLTFILEDKNKLMPSSHPVVFEMYNPQGQVVNRLVRSTSENGFYKFATATSADAPTGNWTGRVKVGGTEFSQTLKIETVKPNRLKINLDFGTDRFTSSNATGKLDVKWLHGAPGRNLRAVFDMLLVKVPTQFPKYPEYIFEDPARSFNSEAQPVFEGLTDDEGKATVNVSLESSSAAPGFLNAIFRGKVYEESGNFSIDRFSIPYSPYESYVGMKAPEGEKYSGILYFDKQHTIDLVTVDGSGNPVSRNDLDINMYKLGWRWWWDNSEESLANYVEGSYSKLVKSGKAKTVNGKGSWTFEMKQSEDEYGRYFVRVCDPVSGHCTGQIIYIDEPGWYSRNRGDEANGGATMLSFSADKASYNIGEKVNLTIPGGAQGGRALVSIENGSKVLQTYWVETQQGETKFSFDVTSEMTPNVYIHVALLQPHAQTVNDLPIRLYGITSIRVEDPATHLEPIITMPEVLEPGQEVSIKISEKSKRKMTYTIAVVDEGLLDITRFKTPDAWSRFYAREALGVHTWDIYDNVMGAFGAHLERLLAIGGDAESAPKDDDARANRFKPVVKFFGPFTLDGSSNTHTFTMPQYIGSVKTMVVAGYEGAYGKAEKATPVRKPLMVLATLPRVLGPEETVKLPVTLFTQEKGIKNVKIDVKVSGPVSVTGGASKSVAMPASGDLTVDFDVAVKAEAGIAKVEVTASSGKFTATDIIEIDVRNPNLPVTKVTEQLLEAGKTWTAEAIPFGISGTNSAVLEVSSMPPVNLGSRLRYLIQYPHGCIEQTTSSVFPQIYLSQIKVLTPVEQKNIQRNVTAGIERLKSFIQRDGGFGYWPGAESSDPWGSNYAGHFLVEAEAKGYYVPADMLKRWKKYQKNKALEWRRNTTYYYSDDLIQAYRLYTLALAGAPEVGAMNRLREQGILSSTAAWMLAASYAKAGQPEAAKKLVANLSTKIKPYRELSYSYGSDVRDRALILETLLLLNEKTKAFELLKEISRYLSDYGYWMSTQETAFCLKAVGTFASIEKHGALKFSYTLNGKTIDASTELPIAQVQIPITGVKKESIKIVSDSKGALFARLIMEGTPARGQEEDTQSDLHLNIRYTDADGREISPVQLTQGTEFIAEVTVEHIGTRPGYQNLALSQVFPSGWEINNLRLQGDEEFLKSSPFDYQDIRDDRVYTYFGLSTNESRTFRVMLTASYAGSFYLPATSCEAMYDKSIYARKKGQVVEVIKPAAQ
ncbi:MAG TPA: MG2 domain-containing protein [Ohtaekwangia sp.]|uniref:alpha-2-macroglobulin family protein n=1 Tax=Ohtaekwangia sp. TaxID=2066019 RepID=UPI002F91C366